MNRKRLEHGAGILRDMGLASLIGGTGDAALNSTIRHAVVDMCGVVMGIVLLAVSVYAVGLDLPRGRE